MKQANVYMCADLYDPDYNVKFFAFDEKITLYIEPDNIVMWRCYPQAFMTLDENEAKFDQL